MQKGILKDLNDLYYFAQVAQYGGFSAASRALDIPKSKLSARVLALENRLGVLLFQRTTRRVKLTETGSLLLRHAQIAINEAEIAQELIDQSRAEPSGLVRVSCPKLAADVLLSPCLPTFMAENPGIQVQLLANDNRFDPVTDKIDVALRLRQRKDMSEGMIARELGQSVRILVASPQYLAQHPPLTDPQQLSTHDLLTLVDVGEQQTWDLEGPEGEKRSVRVRPRLMCSEWGIVRSALYQHLGIALLPDITCHQALLQGELVRVLPQWACAPLIMHAVFPTRRGMLPSVRALVDFLAIQVPPLLLKGAVK
ncbi:D-malate degradation protein R [Serratia quinivorans]|jgi:DNA-binding transcriptional LysR family regulator|uniref:LysR family transcriptional regulator n=1 Tax=Serratia TaxID=613 RepID=UPI002178F109|nr:LysR family transcriptional regulator [Serratia quinivorans]CAI0714133.1 D-malate degradation protein R [Serratia quinivorans]CAI0715592.1 D-malate degradation protein R [Serratia quinivorans]CAI0820490.1 D-malate degradation protein R [Serratia quinivorans]CAI0850571.1 D-malate degradation protein R [Serratia quinivorans]CAI0886298.1 D-malate degradation protein R [Serratia quinivorans]